MGIKGKTKSDLIKMKRDLLEDIAGLKEALGMVQNSLLATLSIKATIKAKKKKIELIEAELEEFYGGEY